jgi:tetratricopeptide (TPR) repeat protein
LLSCLGRNSEALAHFERGLAVEPQVTWLWINEARALYHLGRNGEALGALDRARPFADGASDEHTIATSTALVLTALGRDEEALPAYDRALALDPLCEEAWTGMGELLLHLGQLDRALKVLDHATRLDEGHAPAWHQKAAVLRALSRADEAAAAEERGTALDIAREEAARTLLPLEPAPGLDASPQEPAG